MSRTTGAVILVVALAGLTACAAAYTPTFGVRQGQLAPCPESRACVSSQAKDSDKLVKALSYTSGRELARQDLIHAIHEFHGARIVSSHRNYLRAEFPSTAAKDRDRSEYYFESEAAIDDVEFYLVPSDKLIEVRSVSRLGLVDMGENRQRIERLRKLFAQLQERHERR